ncbi:Hint domain-containing protein [Roseovarius pelagicus]|uniref:Hint domain-containing protein n=1 Tax=Roseovarius pelagicus TaxID=2980108 RepID=A0ABY6D9G5_9RHOB|nr:Hint domain-containing protein [Roseovarius pelagicus]UXX82747.1 Hint domain-containing protein [Roseovarius pelagicus]
MGTPTIGGQTTGAVTENSGIIISGNLDDVGLLAGNNDDTWSISSSATYGTATINPTTGVWSYDLNDSHPVVHALDPGDTLTDVFTVYMLDADGQSDTQNITITISGAVCFAAGSQIETAQGLRRVECLRVGDRIHTLDRGLQPLRWVGRQDVSADALRNDKKLRPIRIAAGALGQGLPRRDLLVSRQHRMLISGPAALKVFGCQQVLIPAIKLVGLVGISIERTSRDLQYFHLLLDAHHIVFAEGAPSETLLPGPQAMALLPPTARDEIRAILARQSDGGSLAEQYQPARLIPANGTHLRQFRRQIQNTGLPLIAPQTLAELVP